MTFQPGPHRQRRTRPRLHRHNRQLHLSGIGSTPAFGLSGHLALAAPSRLASGRIAHIALDLVVNHPDKRAGQYPIILLEPLAALAPLILVLPGDRPRA